MASPRARRQSQINLSVGADNPRSAWKKVGCIRAVRSYDPQDVNFRLFLWGDACGLYEPLGCRVFTLAVELKPMPLECLLDIVVKLVNSLPPFREP